MIGAVNDILFWFNSFVIIYFVLFNTFGLLLATGSGFYIKRYFKHQNESELGGLYQSDIGQAITLLLPVGEVKTSIADTIRRLPIKDDHRFQVVVINMGGPDSIAPEIIQAFNLEPKDRYIPSVVDQKLARRCYEAEAYPGLLFIEKEKTDLADALNTGLNAAKHDLIYIIGTGDSVDLDALRKLSRLLIDDERHVAVGGFVESQNPNQLTGNEAEQVKHSWNITEYPDKLSQIKSKFAGLHWLGGFRNTACRNYLFQRREIIRAGGFLNSARDPEKELLIRLFRINHKSRSSNCIKLMPEIIQRTSAPGPDGKLSSRRRQVQEGLFESLHQHKTMTFNPRYGVSGMLGMPLVWIFEGWGPFIVVSGYITIVLGLISGAIGLPFLLLFLAAAILYGMVISLLSLIKHTKTYGRDLGTKRVVLLMFSVVIEHLGYRQLNAWWKARGMISFLTSSKS